MVLGLHAVIGGDDNCRPHRVKLRKVAVKHRVKAFGLGLFGGVFVLHIIGGRQIHHIGVPFGQQLDPGGKDKFRQFCRIDLGLRHAQPAGGIVLAMFGLGRCR